MSEMKLSKRIEEGYRMDEIWRIGKTEKDRAEMKRQDEIEWVG